MNYLDNKNNSKLQFSFESAITWRGDVNLSHSTTPNVQSEQTTTAKFFTPSYAKATNKVERQISTTITTELVNGKVIANITLDPKQQKVIGAQYKVKFDSSKLIFDEINYQTNNVSTNFSNLKNDYINIGSFVQIKDQYLDGKTKYTLTFTPKVQLDNTLGLVILTNTDAVNAKSEQLKMNIE